MALTHVCMWRDTSWKRISAYEAAQLFPYGTSAHSGLFMCELCGQYVTFINGFIQCSHFRHSAHEKNKGCDDRSESYSYINYFQAEAHNLPIKIRILSSKDFSLSVGFISLPEPLMKGKSNYKIFIAGNEQFTYSFSRLIPGTITYLDVGTKPATKYNISITPSIDGVKSFWPSVISGIDRKGTLFDKSTGKKLPYDADVQVGHEYYLVLGYSLYGQTKTIERCEVCSKIVSWQTWHVYEIKATQFNEEAAKFFLGFHCRLTDEPVTMYPVWPIYIESPYIIYHKSKQINIFFKGNAEPKLAPVGSITRYPDSNPKLLRISSADRQQLLSAGRTDVLKYTYFWESELNRKGYLPSISVADINGVDIEGGIGNNLPDKHTICITSEVDGTIQVLENNFLIEKYELSAGQRLEYNGLHYGMSIKIYQGLDCVWVASYKKRQLNCNGEELKLINRLKSVKGNKIKITHQIGSVVNEFEDESPIKEWLYRQIREGQIQENALKIIKKYMHDKRVRE